MTAISTRRIHKLGPNTYAALLDYLVDNPDSSVTQLAEFTGLSRLTVMDYLRALHKHKLAHISDWDKQASKPGVALWSFARNKRHVPRPPAKTQAERSRAYKQRKRAVPSVFALAGAQLQEQPSCS